MPPMLPAIRYRQIEKTDWVGVPPGIIQLMMLGDH
jgi:hypothetical protein